MYFTPPAGVSVAALDGSASKRLTFDTDSGAIFSPPGVLLFLRQRTLMAQPFDVERLETRGDPIQVADVIPVTGNVNVGSLPVSASADGTIAFRRASSSQSKGFRLAWFDRGGNDIGSIGGIDAGALFDVELSPDGTRAAVGRDPGATLRGIDIWLIDTARGSYTRLTSDAAADEFPVWSPDGKEVVFGSNRRGTFDLYQVSASGTTSDTLLLAPPGTGTTVPTSWSTDGRFILFSDLSAETGYDLWALPLFGDRKPFVVAGRSFDEQGGRFSRDMRWIAYESNEADRFEIFVQQFPNPSTKWRISSGGGMMPRWRADGRELFYVASDGTLMGVRYRCFIGRDDTATRNACPTGAEPVVL